MRRRLRFLSVACCAVVILSACGGGDDGETASPGETPTPTPIPTETTADEDEGVSDAEKALIDDTFIPPGLEPSGVLTSDETPIAGDAFIDNGGTILATQTWEGHNEASGITFISDIRYEFESADGAKGFLTEAEAELTAFVTSLENPKAIEKRFTYLWSTGNLVAFIVIGGSDELEEGDARAGAVLVEQRMETITGVDSDGDGDIGS